MLSLSLNAPQKGDRRRNEMNGDEMAVWLGSCRYKHADMSRPSKQMTYSLYGSSKERIRIRILYQMIVGSHLYLLQNGEVRSRARRGNGVSGKIPTPLTNLPRARALLLVTLTVTPHQQRTWTGAVMNFDRVNCSASSFIGAPWRKRDIVYRKLVE